MAVPGFVPPHGFVQKLLRRDADGLDPARRVHDAEKTVFRCSIRVRPITHQERAKDAQRSAGGIERFKLNVAESVSGRSDADIRPHQTDVRGQLSAERGGVEREIQTVRSVGIVRACLKIPSGAVFVEKAGWRGATKENTPCGSSTEEQRSQTAFSSKTLRGGVAFGLGLRCRERHSPLWGCSVRSASPQSKIPSRSTTRNFKTGSEPNPCSWFIRRWRRWTQIDWNKRITIVRGEASRNGVHNRIDHPNRKPQICST